ncbi:nucleoside triphosphate pyrophosphohydrolase [candidate division GN15 bacterium]|uniref:Nucleoside triphosphate pyrophosphohydrolase n=1 Tax=candidate division GN15 bacterium TaxID=2072418 RepID=A0A855WVC1_9BACT|nr:MAG: nucleoside triphosphate pyrophosphohydrolase [candidate division GN15 bacterium]
MNKFRTQIEDSGLSPYDRIVLLFAILRSPEGCKWDRAQTHETLLPYLIEEAYEVVESIETGRYGDLKEELGDLLTQVVFHAQLASERGEFDLDDVITQVVGKLVARHPHVFGEPKDLDPQQVRDQWERIKTESGEKESVLAGLPRTMPALTMAFRMGEKAGGVGFDWKQAADVVDKIDEELGELKEELAAPQVDPDRLSEEIGDLLFAVASLGRKLHIEPEVALRKALEKFRNRFDELERRVRADGGTFQDYSLEELEAIWQQIKSS